MEYALLPEYPAVSAGPSLLHVADVEETVRFLVEGFGFAVTGSCRDESGSSLRMLQDPSGSCPVVVLPNLTDFGDDQGHAAESEGVNPLMTLATESIGSAAARAVRAGAHLKGSRPMPTRDEEGSSPLRVEEGDQGMISLDGPNGTLRVVLIQRLLLLPSRCRRPSPAVAHGEQTAGRSSGSNGLSTTERAALRKASDTTRMGSSRQVGSAESSGGVPVTEAITATREMPMLHPVLLGLAALARKSTSPSGHETNSHSGANSLDPSRGRISDHLSGGSNRTARSVATNGTEGQEEWFSARELQVSGDDLSVSEERRINLDSGALGRHPEASPASETRCSESHGEIRSVPGGSGNADIEAARLKVEQQLGLGAKDLGEQSKEDFAGKAGMGLSSQHSADSSVKSIVGGGPAVESDGKHQNEGVDGVLEGPDGVFNGAREGSPESAPHGSDVVSGSPAQVGSGIGEREEKARRPSTTPAVTCTSVERPFGMLEVFMLGNANGPLKAAPNSLAPIPIDNEYFEGAALLMLKREPMDKAYANTFEGKNRMFVVQVQGKFKKEPEGDLFIALEITERMKLGLLTKGLCKLLLSFGQRLNSRLHYSFGDKDNKELPHIAFPLVTSVDSLIRTPDGEEPPILGQPFEESKESKARRKRGDGDSAGFGSFETGYTYNFSFHSMYIDMVNWSTCKIPVMRDVDLHSFWGNSALRITAYVIKSPSSSGGKRDSAALHLQAKLDYVFCVQVRHLTQAEQDEASQGEAEDVEALHMDTEAGMEGAEVGDEIALPLLTDREPSPRGRHMSASRWISNDDASDGETEGRRTSAKRRQAELLAGGEIRPPSGGEGDENNAYGVHGDSASFDVGDGSDDSDSDQSSEDSNTGDDGTRFRDDVSYAVDHDDSGRIASGARSSQGAARTFSDGSGERSDDRSAEFVDASREGSSAVSTTGQQDVSREKDLGGKGKHPLVRAKTADFSRKKGGMVGGRGGSWGGDNAGAEEEVEDCEGDDEGMVRCPAYVDLYARSAKLKGTWTVYCVVKRAEGGEFCLRTSKNLSILPSNIVPKMEHVPRLSRQERKRRKLDTILQLLTAPSHAHLNRSHKVLVRAVLGVESSADRAYRAHNPMPSAIIKRPNLSGGSSGGRGIRLNSPLESSGNYADEKGLRELSAGSPLDGIHSPVMAGAGSFDINRSPDGQTPLASPSRFSNKSGNSDATLGGSSRSSSGRRVSRAWGSRPLLPIKEGMILRVLSEHHLSQQMAVLVGASISFSRPRKQCLCLLTEDIMSVDVAGLNDGDGGDHDHLSSQFIPGMYTVELHTVGRVHYMLVEGLREAISWAGAISSQIGNEGRSPPQDEIRISDPFSQYMTKKSSWKAKNFWVLNCRRMELFAGPSDAVNYWGGGCWMDGGDTQKNASGFVSKLLDKALKLHEDSKTEQLIDFLDDVCKLRWMPLEGLSHNEQLSVFLNLYHVMILHAFFLLGPPSSPLRVTSYFTTLCYEVGGDVLSMADLEHCILRAKTSQPKQFLSKLIIPSAEFPFSLRQPEPRVSFALNCGSASGVPGVLIYRPDTVEQQLEDASTYYVSSTTEVNVKKRTVILPKILSWYSEDFSTSDSSVSGSSLACLVQVKRYLTGEKRRQVEGLLSDRGHVHVKFNTWSWKCRPFTLIQDSELANLGLGQG